MKETKFKTAEYVMRKVGDSEYATIFCECDIVLVDGVDEGLRISNINKDKTKAKAELYWDVTDPKGNTYTYPDRLLYPIFIRWNDGKLFKGDNSKTTQ